MQDDLPKIGNLLYHFTSIYRDTMYAIEHNYITFKHVNNGDPVVFHCTVAIQNLNAPKATLPKINTCTEIT